MHGEACRQLQASDVYIILQDPPENAVVTMCGHVFCYQCVSDHLTGEDNTCPAHQCKEQLGADVVYSRSTLRRCLSVDADGDSPVPNEPRDESAVLQSRYVSSKIKSALEILNSCISKSQSSESRDLVIYDEDVSSSAGRDFESASIAPEKAIVFSQWTSMLDLVEMSLKNNHISYRRLDGTMSIAARDKAVKDFNTDPEVGIPLSSLVKTNWLVFFWHPPVSVSCSNRFAMLFFFLLGLINQLFYHASAGGCHVNVPKSWKSRA